MIAAAVLAACSADSPVPTTPSTSVPAAAHVSAVVVTPGEAALIVGDTLTLRASVIADAGSDGGVIWSSSDPSRLTVSPTGLIRTLAPGKISVTAASRADGTKFGAATVTASNLTSAFLSITSITNVTNGLNVDFGHLAGSVSVNVNLTVGARAPTVLDLIATSGGRDSTVASVALRAELTVGQLIQVPLIVNTAAVSAANVPDMPNGIYLFAARLTDATGGHTSSPTSQVTIANIAAPAAVSSVAVSPASSSVTVGGTAQLSATLRDAQGNLLTQRSVMWGSSDPSRAQVHPSTGLVTGMAAGTATITATSEGRSGSATVTVSPPSATTVAVTPAAVTLTVGCRLQLSAQARDANGNVVAGVVQWETANSAVVTISQAGLTTAIAPGATSVTARVGSAAGSAAVQVQAPLPGTGGTC